MAKKKQSKYWSKKKINNKLFFGIILLTLLLCVLVVFGTYFQNISWKNLAQNITNFSIPTPTLKPDYIQQSTPIPTSIVPSLSLFETPDELIVSRSITQDPSPGHDNAPSYFRTIGDSATVQKLYNALLALPPPPSRFLGSCVAHPYLVKYDLTFFRNGKQVQHGTINMLVGCAAGETVNLDGTYERQFATLDKKAFASFISVLENSFGVTGSQLYQMPDQNWLQMRGVPEKSV